MGELIGDQSRDRSVQRGEGYKTMKNATQAEPEYRHVEHDGCRTAFLDVGEGEPIVLIHGSGPGVSALANWQRTLESALKSSFRLLAPDVAGFGDTMVPDGMALTHQSRVEHLEGFLSALGLERVRLIGNSMGGALALALASRQPDRIVRMVLMGSVGVTFPITEGLEKVWGYEPSRGAMEELLPLFAFDKGIISPDLVDLRFRASVAPGRQERYAAAFPPPRQAHVDAMALTEDELRSIAVPTLLIHGAHDAVVPLVGTSLPLVRLLPAADLLVLGRCGHWTQIERAEAFQRRVEDFMTAADGLV